MIKAYALLWERCAKITQYKICAQVDCEIKIIRQSSWYVVGNSRTCHGLSRNEILNVFHKLMLWEQRWPQQREGENLAKKD